MEQNWSYNCHPVLILRTKNKSHVAYLIVPWVLLVHLIVTVVAYRGHFLQNYLTYWFPKGLSILWFSSLSPSLPQLTGLALPKPHLSLPWHVAHAALQHPSTVISWNLISLTRVTISLSMFCLVFVKRPYDLGETDDQEPRWIPGLKTECGMMRWDPGLWVASSLMNIFLL